VYNLPTLTEALPTNGTPRTQEERILDLLRRGRERSPGGWVTLPEILDLRISQYGARIFGLRQKGFEIQNDDSQRRGDVVCSRFRLVSEPGEAGRIENARGEMEPANTTGSLFGELRPDRTYLE